MDPRNKWDSRLLKIQASGKTKQQKNKGNMLKRIEQKMDKKTEHLNRKFEPIKT